MTTTIVSFDVGSKYTGYAVLVAPARLCAAGTWIPRRSLSYHEQLLWLVSRAQDLLAAWPPDALAFEDAPVSATLAPHVPPREVTLMQRFVGALYALALLPPYPVVWPLAPTLWGTRLCGGPHTKTDVAEAVNTRLQTAYKGDVYDNHTCDSIAIALVALDLIDKYKHSHKCAARVR